MDRLKVILLAVASALFVFTVSSTSWAADPTEDLITTSEALQRTLAEYAKEEEKFNKAGSDDEMGAQAQKLAVLQKKLNEQQTAYNKARAAWVDSNKTYFELIAEAQSVHKRLAAQVSKASPGERTRSRRRAMLAIEEDIQRLVPAGATDYDILQTTLDELVKAGRPDGEIASALSEFLGDDPSTKRIIDEFMKVFTSQVRPKQGAERAKALKKALGQISDAISGLDTARTLLTTERDPLQSDTYNKLLSLFGLGTELAGDRFDPIMSVELELLKGIQKILPYVKQAEIRQNLVALEEQSREHDASGRAYRDDWLGLSPDNLFGKPGALPEILPAREKFHPDINIRGTWHGSTRFPAGGWIGLFKKDAPKGNTDLADENDLAFVYMNGEASGTFSFKAGLKEGRYEIRMFNDNDTYDGLGQEVATASVTVEYPRLVGKWRLTTANAFNGTILECVEVFRVGTKFECRVHTPSEAAAKHTGLVKGEMVLKGDRIADELFYSVYQGKWFKDNFANCPGVANSFSARIYDTKIWTNGDRVHGLAEEHVFNRVTCKKSRTEHSFAWSMDRIDPKGE